MSTILTEAYYGYLSLYANAMTASFQNNPAIQQYSQYVLIASLNKAQIQIQFILYCSTNAIISEICSPVLNS